MQGLFLECSYPRSYLASAAGKAGRRIYTVGGDLNVDGSTAECLDLESGRWYPIAPTLTKRDSLGLVNLDGGDQLYAVGGYNNLENTYLRLHRLHTGKQARLCA